MCIIFTSNASNNKVCKKDIAISLLKQQLDKVTTNETDEIIANVPKTNNDLITGYTIVYEKKEYCVEGKHYESKIKTIMKDNNGITRLFYKNNGKITFYALIKINKHRYITNQEKEELKLLHLKWSLEYPWDYLIEFDIL
jgi:hypothetical protein